MAPRKQVPTLQKLTEQLIARKLELYHIEHTEKCKYCWKYAYNPPQDGYCRKLSEKCDEVLSYVSWSSKADCIKRIALGRDEWDDTSVPFAAFRLANNLTLTDHQFFYSRKGREVLQRFGKDIICYKPATTDCISSRLPVFKLAIKCIPNITVLDLDNIPLWEINSTAIGTYCSHLKCLMSVDLIQCEIPSLLALLFEKTQNGRKDRNICTTLEEIYVKNIITNAEDLYDLAEKLHVFLKNCKNLHIVNLTSRSAQMLRFVQATYQIDCTRITVLSDSYSSSEDLIKYRTLFPKIQSVYLEYPQEGALKAQLHEFMYVTKLYLKYGEAKDLSQYFSLRGSLLTEIHLHEFKDINLTEISTHCPNLEVAGFQTDFFMFKANDLSFPELQTLNLWGSWFAVDGSIVDVIKQTIPKVQRLIVSDASTITKDDYKLLFDTKLFPKLETLELRKAHNLSLAGLRGVIDGCPELRSLIVSTLKHKVTVQELSDFHLALLEQNIDVKVDIEDSIVNQVQ